MLILLVGAKGGVGTTGLALQLVRQTRGVGLDLYDGRLAARLDRETWGLSDLARLSRLRRERGLDQAVKRRVALLWTPACEALADDVWPTVRGLVARTTVIADGGLDPPRHASELADRIVIVSSEDAIAQWHATRLARRHPGAMVVTLDLIRLGEAKRAARELMR